MKRFIEYIRMILTAIWAVILLPFEAVRRGAKRLIGIEESDDLEGWSFLIIFAFVAMVVIIIASCVFYTVLGIVISIVFKSWIPVIIGIVINPIAIGFERLTYYHSPLPFIKGKHRYK